MPKKNNNNSRKKNNVVLKKNLTSLSILARPMKYNESLFSLPLFNICCC